MSDSSSRQPYQFVRPEPPPSGAPEEFRQPSGVPDQLAVVIVGAGGFAREVLDVIEAIRQVSREPGPHVLGVTGRSASQQQLVRLAERGVNYFASDSAFLDDPPRGAVFVVGVGDPAARAALAHMYRSAGLHAVTLIHPDATIGTHVRIGSGVVICAGARISTNVTLRDHVHVNPGALVGHDAVIGESASINPGAVISGEVTIGPRTLVGAGAVVLEHRAVGADCVVGAAACVTRDVDDGMTVAGVPAHAHNPMPRPSARHS